MALQETTRQKIRELIMEDIAQQRKAEGGPSPSLYEMENLVSELVREVGQDTLEDYLGLEKARLSTQKKTALNAVTN